MLVGQLLPTAAIIVPLFMTLRYLHLVNTYLGLILVYMIITLPLSVWMLTSYFKAIPVELEEAAIIDGASRLGVLFRITLPLSIPGLVAVMVYAFVTTWNEFIFALCFAPGCLGEDTADRACRVHHRVQHRLGRRHGGLDDHDRADRGAVPVDAEAVRRRADGRRDEGLTVRYHAQERGASSMTSNTANGIPAARAWNVRAHRRGRPRSALLAALEIGYRHIDTAQSYGTEENVGARRRQRRGCRAVTSSSPPRSRTPIWKKADFLPSVERSLETLGVDRIDLLLIHWPSAKDAVPFEDYMLGAGAKPRKRGGPG